MEDPSAQQIGSGEARGDMCLPHDTPELPCATTCAPKHHDVQKNHIPQTQHTPHCTSRPTTEREHRENPTTQQPKYNTRRWLCCNPTQPSSHLTHNNKDSAVSPHREQGSTGHRPCGTCWTGKEPRPNLRPQTEKVEKIDPLPVYQTT